MKYYFLIIFLVCCSLPSNGQFNTIRRAVSTSSVSKAPKSSVPTDTLLVQERKGKRTEFKCSMPLERAVFITSPYGYRIDPFTENKRFHNGIDLKCSNDKVLAMLPGIVKKVGYKKKGLGNYVVISHKPFDVTYGHLEYVLVSKGDSVLPRTVVAVSGNSGRSTGPHLHLEIKYRGKRCDPLPLLAFIDKTIRFQKIKENIMNNNGSSTLTALEHVQDAYSDEFALFIEEQNQTPTEESALLFLEKKENEVLLSEQSIR